MKDLEFSPLGGYLWGTPKERKKEKREEKKRKRRMGSTQVWKPDCSRSELLP